MNHFKYILRPLGNFSPSFVSHDARIAPSATREKTSENPLDIYLS